MIVVFYMRAGVIVVFYMRAGVILVFYIASFSPLALSCFPSLSHFFASKVIVIISILTLLRNNTLRKHVNDIKKTSFIV